MKKIKGLLSNLIARTPMQYLPVTVRSGIAKGARWTLLPHSANWRGNTEHDIETAIRLYGSAPGAACWDLGTHFGVFTVGMAMAVGNGGQVVGFEPDPVSFKRCQRHVRMNSLAHVKLYNCAVSNTEGSFDLIQNLGKGATTSHLAYDGEHATDATTKTSVRTVVLDLLVARGEIHPPQFIKVDIEGHGHKALSGAQRTITTHRPIIVMSFHSPQEIKGTRELLEPLGYRAFTCEGKARDYPNPAFSSDIVFHT